MERGLGQVMLMGVELRRIEERGVKRRKWGNGTIGRVSVGDKVIGGI